MQRRDILLAILVALIWGGNFVAIKVGTQAFPPIFMLSLRFALVSILMLPFVRRPAGSEWKAVLTISIALGGLHFGLLFLGLSRIEASTAAIATQLGVPFSTLLAVLLFKDRLGARRLAGVVVAFIGVIILAGAPREAGDGLGIGLVVAAAFAWAVANSLIKRLGPLDPYMLTGWMALFATPQLLGISALAESGQWQSLFAAGITGWAGLVYTAVGSSITAYSLWYFLINQNPVSQVVPFTLLAPVFGVLASVALLGEPLTWPLVLGGAITISGVALCELRFKRERPAEVAVPPE